MRWTALVIFPLLLVACATQSARDSWVDPSAISNPEQYKADFDICSTMAIDHFKRVRGYSPQPSGEEASNMMLDAMRTCLRSHGYTPRR